MSRKMESFKMRKKPIIIILLFIAAALLLNTFYVSAVDTYFSNHYPTKNSTIISSNPKISTYVKSANELDSSSLIMKLNGDQINGDFVYKGRWITDFDGIRTWVITDRREGTISYDATNLKDGQYTIYVSIADRGGNTLTDTWTFSVAEPPRFENFIPSDKGELRNSTQISATVKDNDSVNWETIKLKINNAYVDSSKLAVDRSTGVIKYDNNFTSGNYTAVLEAKDTTGLTGTKTWSFTVDSNPPELVGLYDFKNGATISDGILKFRAELKDLIDIKDNVTLSVDGTPLKINFRYRGFTDNYGNFIITSKNQAYVTFEGPVPNGNHNLSLYTEDKLGNKTTRTWDFAVSAKPEIYNETPLKYGVDNLKTTISAVVKSPNGSVNSNSIVLKVDGAIVNHNYDPGTGILSYTPSTALENESYHTVNIAVSDLTGLTVNREWRFYTNTYPDMKDSNVSSCLSCHPSTSTPGTNGVLEEVHIKYLGFGGSHSGNKCENCHNYITYSAGCSQCHDDPENGYPYAPHGSTPSIKYQAKNFDPYFPIRIKENREIVDCIVCHQPGSGIKGLVGYESKPSRTINNHDIPELHKTNNESCTKCHAQSLTREHARDDRTDKEGNKIDCNTCHQSTDPKVVQAIKDKQTECSACHGEAAHDELHDSIDFTEPNCTACHSNTLTIEHKNRNLTCADCHESQEQKVITAIANKDKTCQACHAYPVHENQHSQCSACHPNKYVPAN